MLKVSHICFYNVFPNKHHTSLFTMMDEKIPRAQISSLVIAKVPINVKIFFVSYMKRFKNSISMKSQWNFGVT
jgi:hypothetical protein